MIQPEQTNLLISFCDLTNFAKISRKYSALEIFHYLSVFYEITGEIIEDARGKVIKFIGDAALILFPQDYIDDGIVALLKVKSEIDDYNKRNNFESRLIVKAHFGDAIVGMLGTKNEKRYDVIGNNVNIAALLPSNGFAITVETFRKLNKETRTFFKKHTPPVTYIPIEEKHKN
ncbi:MAG: adenylate/guanylate cyclase domain-containing protein [Spirochaetales bacterium]|nr:adenylate/guanylate cyclase domain-containing protein [Spirochaetales bacterium]